MVGGRRLLDWDVCKSRLVQLRALQAVHFKKGDLLLADRALSVEGKMIDLRLSGFDARPALGPLAVVRLRAILCVMRLGAVAAPSLALAEAGDVSVSLAVEALLKTLAAVE